MHAVQALYFGLHCSAIEVTTLWFKQLFCFYSEQWVEVVCQVHSSQLQYAGSMSVSVSLQA